MDVPARPKGKRLRRWLLAACALVLALAVAEIALRVAEPPVYRMTKGTYGFLTLSEEPKLLGFREDSLCTFEWDGDPYGTLPDGARITYRIHHLALRGALPAPSPRRVLVVGDSFTFGEGVTGEQTFVARTQAAVRARGLSDAVLINAGVPGYGTLEEAMRLGPWLQQFAPRTVLVVFAPNDAIPLEHSFRQVRDLLFNPTEKERGLRLLGLVRQVRQARDSEAWYLSYYEGERAEHWRRTRQLLGRMRELSRAAGASFAVAYFPLLHRLDARPFAAIRDAVAAACRELDVPFLDLAPAFEGVPERDLWVHPIDHHPNARAHALAAGRLAPFVEGLVR